MYSTTSIQHLDTFKFDQVQQDLSRHADTNRGIQTEIVRSEPLLKTCERPRMTCVTTP